MGWRRSWSNPATGRCSSRSVGCHRSTAARSARWWRKGSNKVQRRRSKCRPWAPPSSLSAHATCPRPSGRSQSRGVRWTPSEAAALRLLPGRSQNNWVSLLFHWSVKTNLVSFGAQQQHLTLHGPQRGNYCSRLYVVAQQKMNCALLNRLWIHSWINKLKIIHSFERTYTTHSAQSWSSVLICFCSILFSAISVTYWASSREKLFPGDLLHSESYLLPSTTSGFLLFYLLVELPNSDFFFVWKLSAILEGPWSLQWSRSLN